MSGNLEPELASDECGNCGASMAGRRPHARFCGRACQLAHLRAHGPSGYADTGGAGGWISASIPPAVLDTVEGLAHRQGVTRTDWLRLAIGDRIETDTQAAAP